jgi:hypothetical protein
MNGDRRRAERHLETLIGSLHLESGQTVPLHIIERSETGCIGTTSAALRDGDLVRITYPDERSQIMTVVRSEQGICAFKYMSATVR